MVLLISFWFTISLFVALPPCFSAADYERFTECSRPFECGSFTNLHYPFWGNGRAGYCGHPDFKLGCKEDKTVEMDTGSQSYRVLSIEKDNILRIIPVESWNGNCPSPAQNISQPSSMFNYNLPSTINLTLAYGCPSKPQLLAANIYPCPLDNTPGKNYWWVGPAISHPDCSNCDVTVIIPVLQGLVQGQNIMAGNVKRIFEDGFEVLYDANDTFYGCCELSQGQCGYNATTPAPTCFCYDGQYQEPCPNLWFLGRKGTYKFF